VSTDDENNTLSHGNASDSEDLQTNLTNEN